MAAQKTRETAIGSKQDLFDMANAVRTYYILEYRNHVESRQGGGPCTYGCNPLPQWDGGTAANGRTYDKPVWFKIVNYALNHTVNPILLVRATFRDWKSKDPPLPNQFTNPLAVQRARRITDPPAVFIDNLKMEEHRFKSATMTHKLYNNLDLEAAARRALHDPTAELTPLYRYCVGKLGGADDVAERFEQGAFQAYVFDREAYDIAWGALIPQELREAADYFYDEVLRCP
jgi:hypothetical protein